MVLPASGRNRRRISFAGVFCRFFDQLLTQTGIGCVVLVASSLPLGLEATMRIVITKPLFAWDALEDSPALKSLRLLLEAVPDHVLLESLRRARGKGRDDHPVEVLWGTLLLSIALRLVSVEACLEEL